MNRFRYSSHNLYFFLTRPISPRHPLTVSPETLVTLDHSFVDFSHSNQFHTNSSCSSTTLSVSSSGSFPDSALASPSSTKFGSLDLYRGGYVDKGLLVNLYLVKHHWYGTLSSDKQCGTRTVSVDEVRHFASHQQVRDILGMIRRKDNDLETKVRSMNVSLNLKMFTRFFGELNNQKRDALAVCDWIRYAHPSCRNDVQSMVIDNLGRLENYDAMAHVLREFAKRKVCLLPLAFEFVSLSPWKEATVEKVLEVLKAVKEPTQGSALSSLIRMFSVMGSFDMADLVMQLSVRKSTFYKIMVEEKCKQGDFQGAIDLIEVMRKQGFQPEAKVYNYLLSNLLKHDKSAEAIAVFEEMLDKECAPDPMTYEIFVCDSCKAGNMDMARKLLDRMNKQGMEPRISTHSVILKGYFRLERFKEAYEYVMACHEYICFPVVCSTLARLYVEADKVIDALNILLELIDRGLRPDNSVYTKVCRRLINTGRMALNEDLRSRLSGIALKSSMVAR